MHVRPRSASGLISFTQTKGASHVLVEAYEDALKYGNVAALKCGSYSDLELLLNGFADGLTIAYSLNSAEREMVRNHAFAAADRVMQAKQH